jgi:replicative DNA helicase
MIDRVLKESEHACVDTGWESLNRYIHDWQKGSLNIITTHPSVSKTSLAINLAYNVALHGEKPVAFFSDGVLNDDAMKNLQSSIVFVDIKPFPVNDSNGNNGAKPAPIDRLANKPQIYFNEATSLPLEDVIAKSKKLQISNPNLACIVIDNLSSIATSVKLCSRYLEISFISKKLKELAISLNIPIILLIEPNKKDDKGYDKASETPNLRSLGSIEQDADVIILMSRNNSWYHQKHQRKNDVGIRLSPQPNAASSLTEMDNKKQENASMIYTKISKNRYGKKGHFSLICSAY